MYHNKVGEYKFNMDIRAIDIMQLLQEKLLMLTGGKDRKGKLIIHIPASFKRDKFKLEDYRKLLHYYIKISSKGNKPVGFTIIVDARGNGNSLSGNTKPLLKMLQEYYSDTISHIVLIKADNFWQKQKASLSVKKFNFEVSNCCLESLLKIVDISNLTSDLDGTLNYDHSNWIGLRVKIEEFLWQVSITIIHNRT